MRDFIHGWFDGIEMIKSDPTRPYAVVGKALKLDDDTVSGMLSGLKLTPYADNAQFYGLAGGKAHYDTLFDTAFVIWRKKGLVTRPVEAKDWADTRFLSALAANYQTQKVEEPKIAAKAPSARRTARSSTSRSRSTSRPDSDEIMPGSYFVLDALGETMTSFGNTYLRVEGNTDATGKPTANMTALRAARPRGEELRPEELPEHSRPQRFQTIGRGSSQPVAANATEAGRQLTAGPTSRSSWRRE